MVRRAGGLVYDLRLSNQAPTPLSGFNLMINKNVYGIQATAVMVADMPPVPLCLCLAILALSSDTIPMIARRAVPSVFRSA